LIHFDFVRLQHYISHENPEFALPEGFEDKKKIVLTCPLCKIQILVPATRTLFDQFCSNKRRSYPIFALKRCSRNELF
jgi:hypothetical protein